ncbi:lipid A biosynthesis lauroyl acyltransferase [Cupriavidus basilensis]|uniref:lipid A biosynthesis lauroyl acyltransferase n=1 Tax=Cupriavidus basilensis TaxID=68895 RepID=UPI0020A67651|nr:lipid A biosynthesis lauroyl acyltransferase [Cupriavidus basilensis]MCP3022071.1 lipid A biosynthesis lauroyl acyltransferase [Cupriavidus basilensis]MDR3384853.1 lipid A biosynthesis lauroyl acyltransferase [Cupriavidus basilensis]
MIQRIGLFFTVSLLRLLAALPYGVCARIGMGLGALLYRIPSRRRSVVQTNLRLCFPDQSEARRHALGQAHFSHVIRSYLERGVQWYGCAGKLNELVELESAIELGNTEAGPTIFLGFHFVAIEAGCMFYSIKHPVASLYSKMSNPLLEQLAKQQRGRFGTEMIPRNGSVRQALRALKSGTPLMLAADMDFGLRDSVFVPFFNVPACTLTSVSRLAALSGARVVPFTTSVLPGYRGYKLKIFDALAGYPSGDEKVDALRMNAFLEQQVRAMPEQYYWVHRRFKHRPEGEAPVY